MKWSEPSMKFREFLPNTCSHVPVADGHALSRILGVAATESATGRRNAILIDNVHCHSLLVDVTADQVQGLFRVWKPSDSQTILWFTTNSRHAEHAARPPIHSFTLLHLWQCS